MRRYIAIDGPIGAGKTSLATMLAERFEVTPIFEAVEENPFLELFYKDKSSYAFQTQIFFLVSRYKQLSQIAQTDIFNKMTICDYTMERDLVFARLNLIDSEYRLYLDIYNQLVKSVPTPDLTIYLQANAPTLLKRISKRGRRIENGISDKYVEKTNMAFNDFFFNYRKGPLLIINTSNIDFVNNKDDFENLVKKVRSDIHGQEFFNPPGSVF